MWEIAFLMLSALTVALMMTPGRGAGRGQGGGGGQRGGQQRGMGLGLLLNNASVQKALGLSADQIDKAGRMVRDVRTKLKVRDEQQRIQALSFEERRPRFLELMYALSREIRKGLAGLFPAEQLKRLRQIELQVRGLGVFIDPDVQAALKVDPAQLEQMKTLAESARANIQQTIRAGVQSGIPVAENRIAILRRAAVEKVATVLSEQQRTIWKEMIGEPFELVMQGRPGGKGGQNGEGPFALENDEEF